MSGQSDIEKNCLVFALDTDVEAVNGQVATHFPLGNESPAPICRNQCKDGITRVGGLIGEVEPGINLAQHAARVDAENDMGCLRLVVGAGHTARLDRVEAVCAAFVGCRAAEPHELGIRTSTAVSRMGVSSLRV